LKTITLSSNYNFESGYGVLLHTLLEELPKHSLNVVPRTYTAISDSYLKYFDNKSFHPNDVDLSLLSMVNSFDFGTSNAFVYLSFDRPRILYTMWESTRVNDLLIEIMNKFKCVIVPNQYNKENFIKQGLNTRIEVLNLFCDTNFYTYKPHVKKDKFVFGISNEDPRKNLEKVARSFLRAFKNINGVELRIKTNTNVKQYSSDKIVYFTKKFSREELRDWYYDLDVYVSGATCEGWGMMQQESMCCGRPIIYTDYGGLKEFISDEVGYQVKYEEMYSTQSWGNYAGKWSEYNEDDMIDKMIYCFNNKEDVHKKGISSSLKAGEYSKERFINNLTEIINDYI
jgi:glycosyltransferase involved in cell wall biosynthesis